MPRPVNEWFAKWKGPTRPEFIPHCTDNMTGDQKWMVWSLERYLNLIEGDIILVKGTVGKRFNDYQIIVNNITKKK